MKYDGYLISTAHVEIGELLDCRLIGCKKNRHVWKDLNDYDRGQNVMAG